MNIQKVNNNQPAFGAKKIKLQDLNRVHAFATDLISPHFTVGETTLGRFEAINFKIFDNAKLRKSVLGPNGDEVLILNKEEANELDVAWNKMEENASDIYQDAPSINLSKATEEEENAFYKAHDAMTKKLDESLIKSGVPDLLEKYADSAKDNVISAESLDKAISAIQAIKTEAAKAAEVAKNKIEEIKTGLFG